MAITLRHQPMRGKRHRTRSRHRDGTDRSLRDSHHSFRYSPYRLSLWVLAIFTLEQLNGHHGINITRRIRKAMMLTLTIGGGPRSMVHFWENLKAKAHPAPVGM